MEKLTEWPGSSLGGTGLGLVHGYVLSTAGGARVEASAGNERVPAGNGLHANCFPGAEALNLQSCSLGLVLLPMPSLTPWLLCQNSVSL